ncbi:UDP-sugar diphosphatase [Desulfuromusa kysingii]|uniref:UDP-sugar diphosphatase n=1 Tax=Desulfuromusa kysingii TaxID=37625 RepID=A0A1H3W4G2_9BACT|nr:NUDIX hydrolase [Desulfuromusa kysingii]SDZ81168.1 UDP-sugar diphosphatase [Desulfuromusa kysingii]
MPFEITNFSIAPYHQNTYVRPLQLKYCQNGGERTWEAVESHDSVSVLLYHSEKQAFLLVRQFRPPVYMNNTKYTCTHELCAGIVDKKSSLKQIAKEEIDEECGYDVPLSAIKKVSSFFTNVGITGSKQSVYFAIINESMKIHAGGGVRSEQIMLEYIPITAAKDFLYNEDLAKTPALMFAFYWFFEQYGDAGQKLSIED